MFVMPMACLLLAVLDQSTVYDADDNPNNLALYARAILDKNDTEQLERMIETLKEALNKNISPDHKNKLSKLLDELNTRYLYFAAMEIFTKDLNPEVDKDLYRLLGWTQGSVFTGMDEFLALQGWLEKGLATPFKPTQINNSGQFLLQKAMQDLKILKDLNQDPLKKAEATKLFSLIQDGKNPEEVPADEKNQTGYLKYEQRKSEMATRLFGPASFIQSLVLERLLSNLQYECRTGRMSQVDLNLEIEKKLAPFLQSEWKDNFYLRRMHLRGMASACLTERGKNHPKLEQIIRDLENLESSLHSSDSSEFLCTTSYRMAMLSQQKRHEECIQEFKKIKPYAIYNCYYWEVLTDIYSKLAVSYEALNKEDMALVYKDLAFGSCMKIRNRAFSLTHWQATIGKDLRDKYAKNKQWQEARNLEERCKLLGIGFDPLPKQAFE